MTTQNRAGRSANRRYNDLARAWRHRFRYFFVALVAVAAALGAAGFYVDGQWKLAFGIGAGLFAGACLFLSESPPARIQNWRWGSEGERKTANGLRRLPASEWKVFHDLQWDDETNVDHVVVGRAGVFLLDTKDCFGDITVDGNGLHFQWPEDPDQITDFRGIFGKEGAASAALKRWIQDRTGVTTWVIAVVVLWGQFVDGPTEINKVTFVRGPDLVSWLRARHPARTAFDAARVVAALEQAARGGLGERQRPSAAKPIS